MMNQPSIINKDTPEMKQEDIDEALELSEELYAYLASCRQLLSIRDCDHMIKILESIKKLNEPKEPQ